MIFNTSIISECLIGGIRCIPYTFFLAGIPLVLSTVLGTLIALARVYKVPILGKFLAGLVTLYQGVPVVVSMLIYNLLFLFYFDKLMAFLHLPFTVKDVDSIWIGVFAITLAQTSYLTEIIRGALLTVPEGQMEAGLAVGIKKRTVIRRIILPQMVPAALPSLTNAVIGAIKSTTLILALGGMDIMAGCSIPAKRVYASLEGYVSAAVIYWAVAILLEMVLGRVQKRATSYLRIG